MARRGSRQPDRSSGQCSRRRLRLGRPRDAFGLQRRVQIGPQFLARNACGALDIKNTFSGNALPLGNGLRGNVTQGRRQRGRPSQGLLGTFTRINREVGHGHDRKHIFHYTARKTFDESRAFVADNVRNDQGTRFEGCVGQAHQAFAREHSAHAKSVSTGAFDKELGFSSRDLEIPADHEEWLP